MIIYIRRLCHESVTLNVITNKGEDRMNYSPKQGVRSHALPHDPFKSSTVPRPIGWISTVSKDGKDNLAPIVSIKT